MKIIISKSRLEACVKNLCKVISKKNALPILGDILFDVNEQEKTVKLTASDSEIWLSYLIQLDDADGGGRFCVPANNLQAMLAEVREQPLAVFVDLIEKHQFEMIYDCGWAKCQILNGDEYPMPIAMDSMDTSIIAFDGDNLSKAVKRSLFATCNDDLRPNMSGVYLNFFDQQLDVVATNGSVLIRSEIQTDKDVTAGVIIPKKVANIIPDIIGNRLINFYQNATNCQIDVKNEWNTSLQFRPIEGSYPKYQAHFMTVKTFAVTCDLKSLLSALKAVKPFTPDSSNMVTLIFNEDGSLVVSGEDYDFATSSNVTIGMEGYTGHKMCIGLKATTLIDILQHLDSCSVELVFDSPDQAITIRPAEKVEDSQEEITCLQMPMMIN